MKTVRNSAVITSKNIMSGFKFWLRFAFNGIFLPVILPWVVYQLYKSHFRGKIRRDRSLQDKVVLITGASSGLGEALAHTFYKAGCKVILAARRRQELERVKNDLFAIKEKCNHHEPKILILDLNELREIPQKAKEALEFYGCIDVLINNGGISYRGEISNTAVDVDLKVMVINYFGHVALTKALLPHMIKANSGHIVAISSIQGKIAIPFRSAYAASKHAMQAFSDCLRSELAKSNICVTVISPGYIRTNLSLNAVTGTGALYGKMDETTASGVDPETAAEAILEAVIMKTPEVTLSSISPKVAIFLRYLFPSLYFYIMKNRAVRLKQQMQEANSTTMTNSSQ